MEEKVDIVALGYSQLVKEHQKTMEENKKRLGME